MKAEMLAAAEMELTEAVSYYNEQGEGLGYEFAAEVPRSMDHALPTHSPLPHQTISLCIDISSPWGFYPHYCRDAYAASPGYMAIKVGLGRPVISGEQAAPPDRADASGQPQAVKPWEIRGARCLHTAVIYAQRSWDI